MLYFSWMLIENFFGERIEVDSDEIEEDLENKYKIPKDQQKIIKIKDKYFLIVASVEDMKEFQVKSKLINFTKDDLKKFSKSFEDDSECFEKLEIEDKLEIINNVDEYIEEYLDE